MVVKAAKNRYYHFSLRSGQTIRKRRKKHKILWLFRRFYKYGALSLFYAEHFLGKDEVTGSSPVSSSKKTAKYSGFFLYFTTKYGQSQILRK